MHVTLFSHILFIAWFQNAFDEAKQEFHEFDATDVDLRAGTICVVPAPWYADQLVASFCLNGLMYIYCTCFCVNMCVSVCAAWFVCQIRNEGNQADEQIDRDCFVVACAQDIRLVLHLKDAGDDGPEETCAADFQTQVC